MMPWIRTVSWSRNTSRLALIACSANVAAFSALIPRCGTAPACAPLPVNRTYLTTCPLLVPPMAKLCAPMSLAVWHIMAISTSVELAQLDQFLLAAHELDLALGPEVQAARHLDEFLGRYRERHDLAAQFTQHFRLHQSRHCAQHHADLAMVPARVGGAGVIVRMRVPVHDQAVQLTDDGDAWSTAVPPPSPRP